jgi:type I restriction enzyme S subunit
LGEVCEFYNGKGHEQFITDNGNFIVVNSKFISTNGQVFKHSSVNLFPLEKNDVTMVMSDIPNGKALAKCFIVPENGKYALNQRICAIRSNEVDTFFLSLVLNRNEYYLAFDSGTGQTNLKKNDVLECPLNLPPTKEEQTQIATILSDMDNEINALETKLLKYKNIKQGMMQNLLTGKIRLV